MPTQATDLLREAHHSPVLKEWEERLHPRDRDGKFRRKGAASLLQGVVRALPTILSPPHQRLDFGNYDDFPEVKQGVIKAAQIVEEDLPHVMDAGPHGERFAGVVPLSSNPPLDRHSRSTAESALESTLMENRTGEITIILNDVNPESIAENINQHDPGSEAAVLSPATRDTMGRTLHEFGHVMYDLQAVINDPTFNYVRQALVLSGLVRTAGGIQTGPLTEISYYAASEPAEAFAEVFALLHHPDPFNDMPGYPPARRRRLMARLKKFQKEVNRLAPTNLPVI